MKIISVTAMRRLEKRWMESHRSPGYELMERAGRAAAEIINQEYTGFTRAVLLVGGGNNGGDALATAPRLDLPVEIFALRPLNQLTGEAAEAARRLPDSLPVRAAERLTAADFRPGDLIIDGLLGIGYNGAPLRSEVRTAIQAANASGSPIVALDLPSAVAGDTGEIPADGTAIRADLTITFGHPKRGLFLKAGPACRGKLRVADIGLGDPDEFESVECYALSDAVRLQPRPAFDTHKNRRGRLLIVAGSRQYRGAARLAALGALRSGAGLVRLLSVAPVLQPPAALIFRELESAAGVLPPDTLSANVDFTAASDALVAGPGLGGASVELLQSALDFPGAVLLDADALNLAAAHPDGWRRRDRLVITPHPGEAHRLAQAFGLPEPSDRAEFAAVLAAGLGAVTVLKGAGTVVAAPDGRISINTSGTSDLGTAGSGDVLSGAVGAVLATGMEAYEAARFGVFLHGLAGEIGGAGLIADDLPVLLGNVLKIIRTNRLTSAE